jgi:hypothetical protein
VGGIDKHALCHSGRTPRRAAAATLKAVGGAVLCGRKPVAFEIMASRKSIISVASSNTLGFGFQTNLHLARRCGPARQRSCRVRLGVATPPDDTPGRRIRT